MGVTEDVNWLKGNEEGVGKIFMLIASKGSLKLRELKELYGLEDWWPVKIYVRALVDRNLIEEREGGYKLTEYGLKVQESLNTMEYLHQV